MMLGLRWYTRGKERRNDHIQGVLKVWFVDGLKVEEGKWLGLQVCLRTWVNGATLYWEGELGGKHHFGAIGSGVQSGDNWEMFVIQGGNKINAFRVVEKSQGGVILLAVISVEIILKWLTEITRRWVWLAYKRGRMLGGKLGGQVCTTLEKNKGTINFVNCWWTR